MNERVVSEQQLAELLRQAEQAHAAYESGLGHRDDDWPAWYAAYIYQRLQPEASSGS